MAIPNSSTAPPNLDDHNIAWHLLVETAIFDSTGYDLLSHEEVDELKKEQPTIIGRIDALKRKLLLETKVRDAAQSLSRLHSRKHSEPLSGSSVPSRVTVNNTDQDSTAEASAELNTSVAKCGEIETGILNLDSRLRDVQLRLLRHTAGVLAQDRHSSKLRYRHSRDAAASAQLYHNPADRPVNQPLRALAPEDFDHRSLYRPASSSDEIHLGFAPLIATPNYTPSTRSYTTGLSNDNTGPQYTIIPANNSLTGELAPQEQGDLLLSRLTGLNVEVEELLSELGLETLSSIANSTIEHTQANESHTFASDHSATASDKQIALLHQGLARVRAAILELGNRHGHILSPQTSKSIEERLAPIWNILHTYEASVKEEATQAKRKLVGQTANTDDAEFEEASVMESSLSAFEGRGLSELEESLKLFAGRALKLAKEKSQLWEQLSHLSLQKQLEIQKNEDAKTSHEQQILGLTNSLSNTLNELSQVSSHQDVTALQLKQEVLKLRSELNEKERLHDQQLKELQDHSGIERDEFEKQLTAATEASWDQGNLIDKLRLKEEELGHAAQAVEHHRTAAGAAEKKNEAQLEIIQTLRASIDKIQAEMTYSESQLLLSREKVEELVEKLQGSESRRTELERDFSDMALSYNTAAGSSKEQSKLTQKLKAHVEVLENKIEEKDAEVERLISRSEGLGLQFEESKQANIKLTAEITKLEDEIQRLVGEMERLTADQTAANAAFEQQKKAQQGKPQAALDVGLLAELESLSKQNEELLTVNATLRAKLVDSGIGGQGENQPGYQNLKEKCGSLQEELKGLLLDYEALIKSSVDFEAERSQLETQVDTLQEKLEAVESNLADERIRWLGGGGSVRTPMIQTNGVNTPVASGETMTIAVLKAEFKKMMRDTRTEHSRALRGEQDARRKLENELRQARKDYSQLQKQSA
ncbi:hypothetical protein DRE_07219 [Drechslerella stenobrocha 248]|uniref:Uncharacterized protein n=1 Tax=Drechslerella stenobrocha 248 TaxID=1043628 RepID=W7HLW3_9PEZI|nr:hypothetical protein DRE_07219 [Drechslerella stenobrocha 248]